MPIAGQYGRTHTHAEASRAIHPVQHTPPERVLSSWKSMHLHSTACIFMACTCFSESSMEVNNENTPITEHPCQSATARSLYISDRCARSCQKLLLCLRYWWRTLQHVVHDKSLRKPSATPLVRPTALSASWNIRLAVCSTNHVKYRTCTSTRDMFHVPAWCLVGKRQKSRRSCIDTSMDA